MTKHVEVFIIGAGPAGLTAAYCLSKQGMPVLVIEKDPVYVGVPARLGSSPPAGTSIILLAGEPCVCRDPALRC
jgi:flavin-dependent dehydrogenase